MTFKGAVQQNDGSPVDSGAGLGTPSPSARSAGINDDGGNHLIDSHLDSEDHSGDGDIAFVTCGGADLID